MISGILFDIGGVLVVLDGMPSLADHLGIEVPFHELHRRWMESPHVIKHETGQISSEEFAAGVVDDLGLSVTPETFLHEFSLWPVAVARGALELLDEIPSTFSVAALSNTSAVHWERICAMGVGGRFQRMYLSHQTGHLKPSREAFLVPLRDMGLSPRESLFLDDSEANVAAARSHGLEAHVVRSPEEARSVLANYGVVPGRASMSELFQVKLAELQPSQLYAHADKLAAVSTAFDRRTIKPLPVKKLGGRLVLTDGHTRAVAALLAGLDEVPASWDQDELDWEAYETCVEWCLNEGVRGVGDLAGRVVSAEDYDRLWLQRCAAMHEALASRRSEERDGSRR